MKNYCISKRAYISYMCTLFCQKGKILEVPDSGWWVQGSGFGVQGWCSAFRHPERRKTSYVKKCLIWKYENWVEGSKRRRILMTLRVVVISSVAERSLLQYVNQHVCAISSTTFLFCVFLLSRTDFLPVCKKDRGFRSGWRYIWWRFASSSSRA